jgi:thiol-disulfide isomerase/thioredoxin
VCSGGIRLALARGTPGQPYDRLQLDLNGDGSLEQERVLEAVPAERRGKIWTTFTVTVQVGHPSAGAPILQPYPIRLWVVVEAADAVPACIRFTSRGFRAAPVELETESTWVILADANNDGRFGEGDSWGLVPAGESELPLSRRRLVGDFAWAGGKAWRLELRDTSGIHGSLRPHDPGVTEAEDLRRRDRYREDREAPRASSPLQFRRDVDAALAEAQRAGQPCFLDLVTTWCGPCRTMDELVYTAEAVVAASRGIVCIKVDGDERRDLVEQYRVTGYPTGILLSAQGEEVARFTGYRSVALMAEFLGRASEER